jgi:hypothetical protein
VCCSQIGVLGLFDRLTLDQLLYCCYYSDWLRLANLQQPYSSTADRRRLLAAAKRHVALLSWQLTHLRAWQRRVLPLIARERDVQCTHVDAPTFVSRVHSTLLLNDSLCNSRFRPDAHFRIALDQCGVAVSELPLWSALVEFAYEGAWSDDDDDDDDDHDGDESMHLDVFLFAHRVGFERLVAPLAAMLGVDHAAIAVARLVPVLHICSQRASESDSTFYQLRLRIIDRFARSLDSPLVAALSDECDVALVAELGARVLSNDTTTAVHIDEAIKHHMRRLLLGWLGRAFGCRSTVAALKLCKQMANTTLSADEKRHWQTLVTIVESNAVALAAILAPAAVVADLAESSAPPPPPPPLPVVSSASVLQSPPLHVTSDTAVVESESTERVGGGAPRFLKRAVLANLMKSVKRSKTNDQAHDEDDEDEEDQDEDEKEEEEDEKEDDDDEDDEDDDDDDDDDDVAIGLEDDSTTFLSSVIDYVTREILTSAASSGRIVTPESIAAVLNCDADLQTLATNVMRKPGSTSTTPSKRT